MVMLASQQRVAISMARPAAARLSMSSVSPKIGMRKPVLAGQPLVSNLYHMMLPDGWQTNWLHRSAADAMVNFIDNDNAPICGVYFIH